MAETVGCIRKQEEVDRTLDLRKGYSFIPPFLRNPYPASTDLPVAYEYHLHVAPEVIPLPLRQMDFREEALLHFSNISE
jgi:hypothetical protein